MVLFRRLLGEVLRGERMQRGMTLREVSAEARVSLGYISEIERGQKEASSELLASLCSALDVPLSDVLRDVTDAVAVEEAALVIEATPIKVPLPLPGCRGLRCVAEPVARKVVAEGKIPHASSPADPSCRGNRAVAERAERRPLPVQRVDRLARPERLA